jgi:hypothetical protein
MKRSSAHPIKITIPQESMDNTAITKNAMQRGRRGL